MIASKFFLPAFLLLSSCGAAEPPSPAARAVRTLEVRARPTSSSALYSGAMEARDRVDLSFRVGGRVAMIAQVDGKPLQEGDLVDRGATLATLDDADLRRTAAAAEAELATAEAQAEGARVANRQAAADSERARRLAADGDIPKAELERIETALTSTVSSVRAAEALVAARVEKLALARSAVADARLTSPIEGVIARRLLDVGEVAAPGMTAFTVIDTSEVRVVFAVPDTRVDALAKGMRLPVRVEAVPGRAFAGTVVKVVPVADPALRSFTIELAVGNQDGALRAGMVASVGVEGEAASPMPTVPLGAVVRDPATADGFAVFVVDGSVARFRPVVIDDLVGNDVVVADGLIDGERVVVEGAPLLHDGATIAVQP